MRLTRDPVTDRLWHPVSRISSQHALLTRTDKVSSARLWHRQLGHLHPDGVIDFLKHIGQSQLVWGTSLDAMIVLRENLHKPPSLPLSTALLMS